MSYHIIGYAIIINEKMYLPSFPQYFHLNLMMKCHFLFLSHLIESLSFNFAMHSIKKHYPNIRLDFKTNLIFKFKSITKLNLNSGINSLSRRVINTIHS